MIKRTITYNDYNGVERTEDFYFNLTKAELAELELSIKGGFAALCERISAAQDTPALVKAFKELLQLSYGVKSDDGRRFIKNKEVLDDFVQTEAYSILFMELATDTDKASEFINAVLPKA